MSETTEDRIHFNYDGDAFKFAGVVLANLALQILTLGIFRFWARTRERRFLWSHVSLDDDRLEYTGKGLELFLGGLVALVAMAAVIVAYQGLTIVAGSSMPALVAVNFTYITVLMFLVHFATYRARRYRLTRTLWRGIRGALTGSSLRYAMVAMAWLPAVVLSLGLAAPFMRIALLRREVNNMHLGDRPFAFDGHARDLFAYWIVPWLTLLVFIAGYAGMLYLSYETPDPETMDRERVADAGYQMLGATSLFFVGGLMYLIAIAWYRVREFRYLASRISFEGMRFSSEIGLGRVAWIYVSYLFTAGIIGMAVIAGIILLALVATGVPLNPDMVGTGIGDILGELDQQAQFYVIFGIMMTVAFLLQTLARVMVFHRLARFVLPGLALTGTMDFSQVSQSRDAAPSLGEGLADALGVGDF